jgi:hypothetical protein
MINKTVIQELASAIGAYDRCVESGNDEWMQTHLDTINDIADNYLPHGSGIDNGCSIDLAKSTDKKVVIDTSFHHMNDVGMYDGWTDHTIIVTPCFDGVDIRVTGRDRNQIKEYLGDIFNDALTMEEWEVWQYPGSGDWFIQHHGLQDTDEGYFKSQWEAWARVEEMIKEMEGN